MRVAGLEPARHMARVLEALASANSAIPAEWPGQDSNLRCFPFGWKIYSLLRSPLRYLAPKHRAEYRCRSDVSWVEARHSTVELIRLAAPFERPLVPEGSGDLQESYIFQIAHHTLSAAN